MKTRLLSLLILGLALVGASGPAHAVVNLRFTPADTTVGPGETGRLSVFVDDLDANVRTIDLYVTYDPAVVTSLGGDSGQAFLDSGFFLFDGFENTAPGQWHGYCVILGSTDWLTGPGELFTWDFTGAADGTSPVIAVEAYVAAGDGTYYDEVVLDGTSITVFDPLSAADDTPPARAGLHAWPNPFNPSTRIRFALAHPGPARVTVHDLRGAEVAVLHDGPLDRGEHRLEWSGRDAHGRAVPAGTYLVRLEGPDGPAVLKLGLVK
ncbi:hypothetical protein KDM41_16965 [bacterium]|nr:hypothetical protein [bacterium]